LIGTNPSARRIFGLQQLNRQTSLFQARSTTKTGQTSSHNNYIDHAGQFATSNET
jgi:hypothetical protein